jgi:hypothetical protein
VLSSRDVERYRRMTPAERLRETFELCAFAERSLAALPPEERARRLALIEREHRESNAELLRGLARAS